MVAWLPEYRLNRSMIGSMRERLRICSFIEASREPRFSSTTGFT